MAPVPATILRALSSTLGTPSIDPSKATLSSSSSGFTTTGCLKVLVPYSTEDGEAGEDIEDNETEEEYKFFVKTSSNGIAARDMFRGEYESLNAIADALQSDEEVAGRFCPRGIAWGCLSDDSSSSSPSISGSGPSEPTGGEGGGGGGGGGRGRDASESEMQKDWFLITEFVDLRGRGQASSSSSLAQRLGRLHSIPAPPPNTGSAAATTKANKRMFGFPVPTFCGDTKQPNQFRDSWADFYAEERLLTVLETSETRNGKDPALRQLVEKTARTVVPRLLGDGHLGYDDEGNGGGIVPVIVHGDLWSGNAGYGCICRNGRRKRLTGNDEGDEEADGGDVGAVVYDPSACYAHSEYELGIMKMFGGFGRDFFNEYHRVVPKTEPAREYEDRLKLYELYHHLNHHAIFGGGYRSGAVSIMQSLIRKYGQS